MYGVELCHNASCLCSAGHMLVRVQSPSWTRTLLQVAPGQLVECDFNPAKGKASAGLAPSSPDGGSEAALSPRRASSGGAGSGGGRGGWEDEEDEDAFLDCLLQVKCCNLGLKLCYSTH